MADKIRPFGNEATQMDRGGVAPVRKIMELSSDDVKARVLGVAATGRLRKRIKEGKEAPVETMLREKKEETAGWARIQSYNPELIRGRKAKDESKVARPLVNGTRLKIEKPKK